MQITNNLLTPNPFSRPQIPIEAVKGIVVHYVGNPGSTADGNRNYFESLKDSKYTYASSHYIIGLRGEIIRCVPENEVAYHGSQANSRYIGIECCHPDATGKFNLATAASLIELSADILKRHKAKDVIRHYDVTGKLCPLYYVNRPDEWKSLKERIVSAVDGNTRIEVNGAPYTVPTENKNGRLYADINEIVSCLPAERVGLRALLEACGYKVEWTDGTVSASKEK